MVEDSDVFTHWAALFRHVCHRIANTATTGGIRSGGDRDASGANRACVVDVMFDVAPVSRVMDTVQQLVDKVQGDFHDNAATLLALSVFLQVGRSPTAAAARRYVRMYACLPNTQLTD